MLLEEGGGGGHVTSSKMTAKKAKITAILDLGFYTETETGFFHARHVEYDIFKQFAFTFLFKNDLTTC